MQAVAQRAQLDELEMKAEEDQRVAQAMRAAIDEDHLPRGLRAREAGHVTRERILNDDDVNDPLNLARMSQKLITAVALLRAMPEPATPEGRNLHHKAQALVEQAALQQAKSSVSRLRQASSTRGGGSARREGAASVHTPRRAEEAQAPSDAGHRAPKVDDCSKQLPEKPRQQDNRDTARREDAHCDRRKEREKGIVALRYRPRCGGHYDPRHDRSISPEPAGTQVFSREIRAAPIPPRFRQPTTLTKYTGETDP